MWPPELLPKRVPKGLFVFHVVEFCFPFRFPCGRILFPISFSMWAFLFSFSFSMWTCLFSFSFSMWSIKRSTKMEIFALLGLRYLLRAIIFGSVAHDVRCLSCHFYHCSAKTQGPFISCPAHLGLDA